MTPLLPTYPEPWGDIAAQMEALFDPDHPKHSLWVSAGTSWPPMLHALPHLDLAAGRLYAADPTLLDELAADPSLETLARILDYVECKETIRGVDVPVVQALNPEGWVVHEMMSSWERVGEARRRAAAYGKVQIISMAQCWARRQRLLAEEEREADESGWRAL